MASKLLLAVLLLALLATPAAAELLIARNTLTVGEGDCIVLSRTRIIELKVEKNCVQSGIAVKLPRGYVIVEDLKLRVAAEGENNPVLIVNLDPGTYTFTFYSDASIYWLKFEESLQRFTTVRGAVDFLNTLTFGLFWPTVNVMVIVTAVLRSRNPAVLATIALLLIIANTVLYGLTFESVLVTMLILALTATLYVILWRRSLI